MNAPPAPIPLTLVTGARGAGKTTLINAALAGSPDGETVVVVNQAGAVTLDSRLAATLDEVAGLQGAGCICCTGRDRFVAVLENLLRRRDNRRMPAFARLVVETDGKADPLPMIAGLAAHPYLSKRYAIAGVVCVLDASPTAAPIAASSDLRRQIEAADVIVLSRRDGDLPAGIGEYLGALGPLPQIIDGADVVASPLLAFAANLHDRAARSEAVRARLYRLAMRRPQASDA